MGKSEMKTAEFKDCMRADSLTHPGLVRHVNEDAVGFFLEDGCFFVADGMGGGSAGDLASGFLENELSEVIEGSRAEMPGLRKYNVNQAIHNAHIKIRNYAENMHFEQMGTTLAVMLFNPWNMNSAWICHIGDSRIYRLRQGRFIRLTRDHTVGAELAERKRSFLSKNILSDHRTSHLSHILTRVVGSTRGSAPEWEETDIHPNDRFLICSDGVSTMLKEKEIMRIMVNAEGPEETVAELSEKVLESGAKDNFSMITVFIEKKLPEILEPDDDLRIENEYHLKISERIN